MNSETKQPFDPKSVSARFTERSRTLHSDPATPSSLASSSFEPLSANSSRSVLDLTFDGKTLSDNSNDEDYEKPNSVTNPPPRRFTTSEATSHSAFRWWMLPSIFVAVVVAVAWTTYPTVDSRCLSPPSDHCHNASHVAIQPVLPFPFPINVTAHEAVLNELHDSQTLVKLLHVRNQVYSALEVAHTGPAGHLACAMQKYSYCDGNSNSRTAEFVLLNRIDSILLQFGSIHLRVSKLLSIYLSLEAAYGERHSDAAHEVQVAQQHDSLRSTTHSSAKGLALIGLNPRKLFRDSRSKKQEKLNEAKSGIEAWEGEVQRLHHIAQVVEKVSLHLGRLRQILREIAEMKSDSKRQWFKQWFWQNIAQHLGQDDKTLTGSDFASWWDNLCCGAGT